jgi:capsular polysaccharide biosynthesis protein
MANQEEKYVADSKVGNFDTIRDDEINLSDMSKVLAKRKKGIIAIFLISILAAAIYCFTASPIYRLETHVKIYMPKDLITIKELPSAKDIVSMIGRINHEKKVIIFSKTADGVTEAKIEDMRGTTDKFKIIIESYNREDLPASLQELLEYIENMREIKNDYRKIISEIDEKIKIVNEAVKKNDFQIKEIEKRLNSSKLLPVGFNPVEINNKIVDLKMEKHRLEQERQNFKLIQLLQDPFVSKDPVKPQKAIIMIIAGILSFMFGVVTVFIAEYLVGVKTNKHHE